VVAFASFAIGGLFTAESLRLSAMFLPAVAAGLAGGIVLAKRLPEGRFKKVALLLLIAAGISSLISGIIGVAG
jgi:mannitol-specific phosphotransferase system IIBC component